MEETKCHIPNRPKRRKPGFNEDMFKETSYYFKDGLRYVYPYHFTFTAYVKKRWVNLTILELFCKEFHMETVDYYKRAIKNGKIKVNNKMVSEDQLLINNDILKTTMHRHEPPVTHQPIEFLQNDDDMVVINKPPSIPVHPCGRYRHNSIVFLLGKEHGLQGLHTIHRIDRLTSGVLMFAKTPAKAKEIEKLLHEKQDVEKEYLARVVGEFPEGEIVINEPVLTASHKIGVCHVHEDGKTCSTKFKRLCFNGKSSVVSCRPQTGRMHQIRVHLQWLGYPIVNDPIYNHPTAWGDGKRKYDISEVINELLRTRKDKSYNEELSTDKCDPSSLKEDDVNSGNDVMSNPKRRKVELSENKHDNKEIYDLKSNDVRNELGNSAITTDHSPIIENNESSDSSFVTNINNPATKIENNESSDSSFVTDINNPVTKIENNESSDGSTVTKIKKDETESSVIVGVCDERVSYTSQDIGEEYVDNECSDCKRIWKEPLLSEMVMYLHSWLYKGPNWEYKTSIPEWAKDDWNQE